MVGYNEDIVWMANELGVTREQTASVAPASLSLAEAKWVT